MATVITGQAFIPEIGKCYEVHFGRLTHNNQTGFWSANPQLDLPCRRFTPSGSRVSFVRANKARIR